MDISSIMNVLQKKAQVELQLTEAQRRLYAAEKQENFRWISKLVATYSEYELSDEKDSVQEREVLWVQEIGQFAEVVYSALPLESLIADYDTMKQPGFPLEAYYALSPHRSLAMSVSQTQSRSHPAATSDGVQVLKSFKGSIASLPAAVFSRWIREHEALKHSGPPTGPLPHPCDQTNNQPDRQEHPKGCSTDIRRRQQVIVSICGTASIYQVLHDLRAIRRIHPAGSARGATVHSGFWDMYQGIKPQLLGAIQEALKLDPPGDGYELRQPCAVDPVPSTSGAPIDERKEVLRELVVTGHSMGGAVAHLFCIDLLATTSASPVPSNSTPQNPADPEDVSYLRQLGFQSLQIVTFGEPRAGNQALVDHWRALKENHEKEYGITIQECCVKGYNDGVPALPPVKIGYRHFAEQPLYTVDGKLYRIPASESEHGLFRVAPLAQSPPTTPANSGTALSSQSVPPTLLPPYPLGGHNYYNERDLEGGFLRRIEWLNKAEYPREGWEDRYREIMKKHLG